MAIALFVLANNPVQGMAANESIIGGLEAKAVAYGFVMVAISLMLGNFFYWMALLLGLATSFHVLVGGYAFLSAIACLILRQNRRPTIRKLGIIFLIYLAASAFAIRPVIKQLLAPTPEGNLTPSYIYVFLRLPHHLNPLAWSENWWIAPVAYFLILWLSITVIWLNRSSKNFSAQYLPAIELFKFTLISLVPFVIGLIAAPFDSQGRLLQYYPFRLGDVVLPLHACLLLACALNQTFIGKWRRVLLAICIVILGMLLSLKAQPFKTQLLSLRNFPTEEANVQEQWKEICFWIRNHTPQEATIIASPTWETASLSWLSERATIANIKLLPQSKAGIIAWHGRLRDLSGEPFEDLQDVAKNYGRLRTDQVEKLMVKYNAEYFIAKTEHQLELPVAYRNSRFILYQRDHQ